jgi:hypothetical protein
MVCPLFSTLLQQRASRWNRPPPTNNSQTNKPFLCLVFISEMIRSKFMTADHSLSICLRYLIKQIHLELFFVLLVTI